MTARLLLVACLASCALPACRGASAHSINAGAMEDATITARVKTALLNDPQISATKIDVTTADGVVTLTGTVRSEAEAARAIDLARQVGGVKDVKSTLRQ